MPTESKTGKLKRFCSDCKDKELKRWNKSGLCITCYRAKIKREARPEKFCAECKKKIWIGSTTGRCRRHQERSFFNVGKNKFSVKRGGAGSDYPSKMLAMAMKNVLDRVMSDNGDGSET